MATPAPAVQDRIGQLVAEKYQLVRLLGMGGMGAVYEARNTWTRRRVAIKFLKPELTAHPDAAARFAQEAQSATAIAHPNIVDVLDMGRDPTDGALFIVQEFLAGGTLRELLSLSGGRLPLDEAMDVAIPVMGALAAAHASGVVHRDVKPENIFLMESTAGRPLPKLIDFGISKVLGGGAVAQETGTGVAMGTPRYMSPEQLRGDKSIDGRCDVWAMGIVLYEMLAGRCPYEGASVFDLASQLLRTRPERLDLRVPGVPRDVADVIHSAIEPDLESRPATMRAMVEALLACPSFAGSTPDASLAVRHRDALAERRAPAPIDGSPPPPDPVAAVLRAVASPPPPAVVPLPSPAVAAGPLSLGEGPTLMPAPPSPPAAASGPASAPGGEGSFLRALAHAPGREPVEPPPERLGRFRIGTRIGKGGMGEVYRAVDETLGREVAIKVLPVAVEADPERRRRFLLEARATAAIAHSNVVTIFEVDEAAGHIFIAMELVAGQSLRQRLKDGRPGPDETLRIVREIARGVAAAHERGIVHRDLKPDNVLLGSDGSVKVVDFGLAKLLRGDRPSGAGPQTAAGNILGTPEYMSPEQAAGQPVDARSDVFSLGVILYELCAGQRPFQAASQADLLAAIAGREPEPLPVSAALRTVVARCLDKDPARRYADARELVAALDRPPDRAGPRPRTLVAALMAVAAAVMVAVGLVVLVPHLRNRRAATTLLDLPAPPTRNAEAASAYAAGIQTLHDNNWYRALEHFERAAHLDPTMAAAHLRVAMACGPGNPQKKRLAFSRAAALRSQLTPRDLALMEALEPMLQRLKEDPAEAARRLERHVGRYPGDVEAYDWLGMVSLGDPQLILRYSEKAIELDPRDAQGWQGKGHALLLMGRSDEARRASEHCTALSVDSSDCLQISMWADTIEGRCQDFEQGARRFAQLQASPHALWLYASVALARPMAGLRELAGQIVAGARPVDRALFAASIETQLALVAGDFERAGPLAERQAAALAEHPTARTEYWPHYHLALSRVLAAEERGDAAAMVALAQDFEGRRDSWTRADMNGAGIELSFYLTRLAAAGGPAAAPEALEAARQAWMAARRGAHRGLLWVYAYAAAVKTPDEARAALAVLPRYAPLTSLRPTEDAPVADVGVPDAEIGRVYLLAGRTDEALPYLRRAAANCNVFNSPFAVTRAALHLGQALEQKGDRPGACEGYGRVLDRWGQNGQSSVTVAAAREGAVRLGCQ
jgi:serine/threonine-protein kinase